MATMESTASGLGPTSLTSSSASEKDQVPSSLSIRVSSPVVTVSTTLREKVEVAEPP